MKTIAVAFLLVTSIGCTRIVFDQPQPAEVEPLTEFPERFQGSYAPDDGTPGVMVIGRRMVTIPETSGASFPVSELDNKSNLMVKDGLLFDSQKPEIGGIPYTIRDSMLSYTYVSKIDTIGLSDTLVAKEMGATLVVSLNTSDDDLDVWDVILLELSDSGDLIANTTGNPRTPDSGSGGEYKGDIDDYGKITPYERLEKDTYLFRPTKRAFMKLVKKGLFADQDTIRRVQ